MSQEYPGNSPVAKTAISGPERSREISPSPPDPLKPVNGELRPKEAEPSEVSVVRKLGNAMRQKFPVAPSYGQNGFFVGWVPNRQKRSPTDEMGPGTPQNRENPLFGVFAPFRALNGAAKFL